jgi:hypothetical protein
MSLNGAHACLKISSGVGFRISSGVGFRISVRDSKRGKGDGRGLRVEG